MLGAVFPAFALIKDSVMPARRPPSDRIVVVGTDGLVVREILMVCAERDIPFLNLSPSTIVRGLGVKSHMARTMPLKSRHTKVLPFKTQIVSFLQRSVLTWPLSLRVHKQGLGLLIPAAIFRKGLEVPLCIASVGSGGHAPVVAAPSGSALMLLRALAPLNRQFDISRVIVSLYVSSAYSGHDGMDELFRQTRGIYVNEPPQSHREIFTKQIAFNAIPQVGAFCDEGATENESDITAQVARILEKDNCIHVNSAHIASFIGAAAYVNVQYKMPVKERDIRSMFLDDPMVSVVDHRAEEGYITPVEVSGENSAFISRIRRDKTTEHGMSFWCVADTTRHEALNVADLICSYA